nr:MAG TPA: hypothetical protein [Caudoviricetes sp.]
MSDNEKDSLIEVLKVLIETTDVASITIRLKPTATKEPKQKAEK